jgi:translation initiation factor IF-1
VISFDGVVVALLERGRRRVRLANDHLIEAAPPRLTLWHAAPAAVGDQVRVQMRPDDTTGWRLALALAA